MKRLFTFVICLALSQLTKANPLTHGLPADSGANAAARRDTSLVPVVEPVRVTSFNTPLFQRRLDSVQKEVPLNYNEIVQSYIDIYTSSGRRGEIGKIIGLSKYYFPIYEKAFREAGIPEEIKFLSIVESALNPNAVSRVGATGPWQFMAATGKVFGLSIDDYVDDRRDPIKASYAAAAYLKDAYQEFGDWLLAIASYNCGKSSVERAIDRSGGATDFWSIRPYLPTETRGYVPAYIAMAYVMNYFNRHNIAPQPSGMCNKADTIVVDHMVSLSNISHLLQIDDRSLFVLNPSYTRGIINGTARSPRRMVLPEVAPDKYAALYDALNGDLGKVPTVQHISYVAPAKEKEESTETPTFHKVRRGETLARIADRYGIELQDLKAWNHIRTRTVPTGTRLRLTEPAGSREEVASAKIASKSLTYTVRQGDTLSGVAEKFEANIERIREVNNLKNDELQPGMTLKITKS
ncbi:membrane-bound lytic murein transglycosylase D [Mucilaginibacter yixingensis]|uniref:Membrane-bound lytic murein transglycosylase D n=1 Tax=Mucilaginibacter yixingensis TaxID=1295612 RepID=A0A2T5JCH5_9SPHI|nr:lytic transglycosylase domain-containing protein [Mucilaginibacter yixingensis]PTQ99477.1 membrane-bound lytic murein transglycosylase D [Mucilaginibacter yixingensis]